MKNFIYPKAKKSDISDNFFGTNVNDPYRWMENENDSDLKIWIDEERKFTKNYIEKIQEKDLIREEFRKLTDYTKYYVTVFSSGNLIYAKNDGKNNQDLFYIYNNGSENIFLNPNTFSDDGTVNAFIGNISKDGKYITYNISESGSDWNIIKIKNTENYKNTNDEIKRVKFTNTAWYKNGFYYTGYENKKSLFSKNESMKVYYHTLGTPQSEDLLFYEDSNPERFISAEITDDEKYIIITTSNGTSGNEVKIKATDKNDSFITIFKGFEYEYFYIGSNNGKLLFVTNENTPNRKIIEYSPEKSSVKEIIKESENYLEHVCLSENKIYVVYTENVISKIYQFSFSGSCERTVKTEPGVISGIFSDKKSDNLYINFSSMLCPEKIMIYNPELSHTENFRVSDLNFNPDEYTEESVFYKSKDGTEIPMFILRKKHSSENEMTVLYGYGGFNIPVQPTFSPYKLLIAKFGIYASACLRGGSEYGEKWHKAGMLENKQNVFDDFIYAAEYLISNKYTSKEKLCIEGRSNGGLLIGAVLNQRPDLFRVAFPTVGVMDMLRFHKFTIGWGWKTEYGCAENSEEEFNYLYKYSPLHNIKETSYPSVMIRTGDHDDRVVPSHSFKYAATLQEKNISANPILIRIDEKAGHGMGKPISKIIDEVTDTVAFIIKETQTKL